MTFGTGVGQAARLRRHLRPPLPLFCIPVLALLTASPAAAQVDQSTQLLTIQRVYVDRLTGDDTAQQIRDLIIASLHNARLFILTEDPERADATIRGAAEDLIYTDQFASSEGVNLRTAASSGTRSTRPGITNRSVNVGVGDSESVDIRERKHEALASIRLVNQEGDVIWSTTQESNGAKFRGASADVADKITHQLVEDFERARREHPAPNGSPPSGNQ